MAYLCTESGNLMAIAQQLIQHQHHQQQNDQQQQQQQQQIPLSTHHLSTTSTYAAAQEPHFPFSAASFPDSLYIDDSSSPFQSPPPPPPPLDHAPFRLSDFDPDEWMDSLISDGPSSANAAIENSDLAELPPLFPDSDLDRLVFPSPTPPLPPPPLLSQIANAPSTTFPDAVVPDSAAPSDSVSPLFASLLDCARKADTDPELAARLFIKIRESASELGEPTQRVGFYFAEALAHRFGSSLPLPSTSYDCSPEELTLCYKAFNDACPYSKFAHLTANQAILDATDSATRIHVIDFGLAFGVQWASLLQALANRPGGKPVRVRITGVPSPLLGPSPAASLTATGTRLRDFARLHDLDFEFTPVLSPIEKLTESCFQVDDGEAVAVNFMMQLHHNLVGSGEAALRLLRLAKSLSPDVLTLGECDLQMNRHSLPEQLSSTMDYCAAVFESLDSAFPRESAERARIERVFLGKWIATALDGSVQMAGKEEWRALMVSGGFESVRLSNYAVSQANLLLWNYDFSPRYSLLDSDPGFLSLAWDGRPLLAVSVWQ